MPKTKKKNELEELSKEEKRLEALRLRAKAKQYSGRTG